jgi:hypothetical protein
MAEHESAPESAEMKDPDADGTSTSRRGLVKRLARAAVLPVVVATFSTPAVASYAVGD